MSLADKSNTDVQAAFLENYLGQWAEAYGGTAKVMANMQHLWEEVYNVNNDGKARILIACNGEKSRGGFNVANTLHRVDRNWAVVIMRGHGWRNNMATDGSKPNELAFYKVIEKVRDLLRLTTCLSEEFPIDYKGWQPLPNIMRGAQGNIFVDAAMIEFSGANDLPQVYSDPNALNP